MLSPRRRNPAWQRVEAVGMANRRAGAVPRPTSVSSPLAAETAKDAPPCSVAPCPLGESALSTSGPASRAHGYLKARFPRAVSDFDERSSDCGPAEGSGSSPGWEGCPLHCTLQVLHSRTVHAGRERPSRALMGSHRGYVQGRTDCDGFRVKLFVRHWLAPIFNLSLGSSQ